MTVADRLEETPHHEAGRRASSRSGAAALFDASTEAVPVARAFALALLADRPDRDVVALLVSELAANAVNHAKTPFEVVITLLPGRTRVEVHDAGGEEPRLLTDEEDLAEEGRGLRIVEGLADSWGWQPADGGKQVWFETRADGDQDGGSARRRARR